MSSFTVTVLRRLIESKKVDSGDSKYVIELFDICAAGEGSLTTLKLLLSLLLLLHA